MPDPFKIPLQNLQQILVALRPVLVDAIGVEALKFVDDNFRKQGFQGQAFEPWPGRKKKDKGKSRKILVQTGALRRSIIKTDHDTYTIISTDLPYAQVHNEGGIVTQKQRDVTLNYNEKGGKLKLAKAGTENQQRRVKQIRRGTIYAHSYKMPKRQYVGESPVLTKACKGVIVIKFKEAIKKLALT